MSAASHISRIQLLQQKMQPMPPQASYMSPQGSLINGTQVDGGSVLSYNSGTMRSQPPMSASGTLRSQPPMSASGTLRSQSGGSGMYRPLAGSAQSYASNSMARSGSRSNLVNTSRSLGASKASMVSLKSGKTSIVQEYHDKEVHREFHAIYKGKARCPFLIAMLCFFTGLCTLTAGLTLVIMRSFDQIFLTLDKGEFIGPFFIAITIAFVGVGFRFLHSSYQVNARERNKIRFRAANASMVSAKVTKHRPVQPSETLASGTASKNAITRTPMGSRSSLANFSS